MPLLTERFTVVAPDLRGFGDTDRPASDHGYDSDTNATDLSLLMSELGHETFHVHGEDRGAEFAFALAGRFPERVLTLSFCEMMLSGFGLEEQSFFTPENVGAKYSGTGHWLWHLPFFFLPDIPELLMVGKEREFWEPWIKAETWDPGAIDEEALEGWMAHLRSAGGIRGVLETYRAAFENARINREIIAQGVDTPIMTVGAPEFFGHHVGSHLKKAVGHVELDEVFERCGHSLALEEPQKLADLLAAFMLDGKRDQSA